MTSDVGVWFKGIYCILQGLDIYSYLYLNTVDCLRKNKRIYTILNKKITILLLLLQMTDCLSDKLTVGGWMIIWTQSNNPQGGGEGSASGVRGRRGRRGVGEWGEGSASGVRGRRGQWGVGEVSVGLARSARGRWG